MGFYDIPAMIDCILSRTNASSLYYIAHSQGTTSLLVLLSMKPEYNNKIVQVHLMAPPAFRRKLPKSKLVLNILRNMVRNQIILILIIKTFKASHSSIGFQTKNLLRLFLNYFHKKLLSHKITTTFSK